MPEGKILVLDAVSVSGIVRGSNTWNGRGLLRFAGSRTHFLDSMVEVGPTQTQRIYAVSESGMGMRFDSGRRIQGSCEWLPGFVGISITCRLDLWGRLFDE